MFSSPEALNCTQPSSYKDVSEVPGEKISRTQLRRAASRYTWAAQQCAGLEVLEVACGCGQGLGLLAARARRVSAGDYSSDLVERAQAHYGPRFEIRQLDAQAMPYGDGAFDAVLLSEALYYLDAEKFVREARRVLRPGGKLLLISVNKDLCDFHPSLFSTRYYGVAELNALLSSHGFQPQFWGDSPVRQSVLRRIKRFAVNLNLIPKTMQGKQALKRLIYGTLTPMPAEITSELSASPPTALAPDLPDCVHEIIFCAAIRT